MLVYSHGCFFLSVCMYVCMHVCTYVHIYFKVFPQFFLFYLCGSSEDIDGAIKEEETKSHSESNTNKDSGGDSSFGSSLSKVLGKRWESNLNKYISVGFILDCMYVSMYESRLS